MRYLFYTTFLLALATLPGCTGCSKSGRREAAGAFETTPGSNSPQAPVPSPGQRVVVQMKEEDGVYKIPVDIDGVRMFFIFDTGASDISISLTEAQFLYKEKLLTNADVLGKASFTDAQGNVSDGTIILLHTVAIGGRTLTNVRASIVHNLDAPLLFGQSALQQFGKVSIDYNNKQISFE